MGEQVSSLIHPWNNIIAFSSFILMVFMSKVFLYFSAKARELL